MPFGLSVAPEISYKNLVHLFLQRCREQGIKLNKEKTTLRETDTKFFGFVPTEQGLQMDPDKQKQIATMKSPHDVTGLKSFLGMLAHISRFLPDLAQVLAPLRELCRTGQQWKWEGVHPVSLTPEIPNTRHP